MMFISKLYCSPYEILNLIKLINPHKSVGIEELDYQLITNLPMSYIQKMADLITVYY
jgi:hypothetical protein